MKKKILAVDDEEELNEAYAFYLQTNGYDVKTASNGIQALQLAKEWNPNLILLDISMPKMNGMEVLWELRRDPQTAAIPVVMVTAHGASGNILHAQALKAVDFLIKPFKVEEVLEAVRKNVR